MMTDSEKLDMTLLLLGEAETGELADRINAYLKAAEKEIIHWRYGYSSESVTEVPEEYEMTQIHAVIAGFSISGAEGQMSHSENGINRSFKYPDMLSYIRSNVIPKVGVL